MCVFNAARPLITAVSEQYATKLMWLSAPETSRKESGMGTFFINVN